METNTRIAAGLVLSFAFNAVMTPVEAAIASLTRRQRVVLNTANHPKRYRVIRTLLATMLCGLIMVKAASADTILINDLTDSIIVQGTTSREVVTPFGDTSLEGVGIQISAPIQGATISSTTLQTTDFLGIAEPDAITFSDAITMLSGGVGTAQAVVTFFSDAIELPSRTCLSLAIDCTMIENGTAQVAGTITWSDGTLDTIQFCSDVEGLSSSCSTTSVPEPATLLLLSGGLGVLVAWVHLKRVSINKQRDPVDNPTPRAAT
jgi:hypothetical protein